MKDASDFTLSRTACKEGVLYLPSCQAILRQLLYSIRSLYIFAYCLSCYLYNFRLSSFSLICYSYAFFSIDCTMLFYFLLALPSIFNESATSSLILEYLPSISAFSDRFASILLTKVSLLYFCTQWQCLFCARRTRLSALLAGPFWQRKLISFGNKFLFMYSLVLIKAMMSHFVQYYQLKEQMQVMECYLQQHFAQLDKLTYKALALTAESSFDEEFNAPPLKVEKYHEERYNDENDEDDSLQEYSAITIDQELINALNRVFDERYMGNSKEALFARHFHMQRKCIKAIEKKKEKLEDDDLKYEEKCFQISLGEDLNLFFTSDDLKSIKKGPIAYCIIQNFVNILKAAKVITESIYVFPEQFLQQLMGGDHFDESKEGLEALKGIISKNFETYHSEININLLEPDYLIIPIFLGECQKCMIVQLTNKTGKNNPKFNVILCNLSEEKGKMYVLAIRTILEMAVAKAKIKKNVNFSTIPILVPRQPSQEDSSLYLLLCLEFLFTKKCAELHDLKNYSSRMKLHLFPRCISLKSREEIYNLFIELAEEQSLLKRGLLCQEFICNRLKIRNDAPMKFNYDDIDQREVKKYLILKRRAISKANTASAFEDIMEYYLDDEINYQRSFQ